MTPPPDEEFAAIDPFLGSEGEKLTDVERLESLRRNVEAAAAAGQGDPLLYHLKSLTGATGVHIGRVYTEALLALARNDALTADQAFQPLCEKLNQAEAWPALARVALEWIEGAHTHPGARYLIRAWKQGGSSVVTEAVLRQAIEIFPHDPDLIWALATTLDEQGSSRESRRLLATALIHLAESRDTARVEEGILRLLEAPEGSIILHALEAVDVLSHKGESKAAAAMLESLQATTISHGLAGRAWEIARRAMEKHPGESGFRPTAVAFLRAAFSNVASLDRVIEVTAIDRIAVPALEALKALDLVLPFAPGYYVEHSGWGLGEIRDNDGDFLTINFPTKPNHRMNLKSAAQVLKSLPADDLKVMMAVAKEKLAAMVQDDPAGLVAIALRRAGGQASISELRKLLVPGALTAAEWTPWIKKTKEKLAGDSRIDSRQQFRDVYRLPVPGEEIEEPFVMPPFDEPKGIDHNVDLIYDFLDHHIEQEEPLKAGCLHLVRRWAERRTAKAPARARARLLLARWDPAGRDGHEAALRELFLEEFDLSAAGSAEEQIEMLGIGLEGASREPALKLGLNARGAAVREAALKALLAEPGMAPVEFFAELVADPMKHTDALFLAIEHISARPADDERLDQLLWPALVGLLDLLNLTGREPLRKRGLKLLEGGSPLMKRVEALPPDERMQDLLTARLRDWRASDRLLFPILESFGASGLPGVVESVTQKRKAAHEKLFAASEEDDILTGPTIMSRFTFDTLHAELEQINLELKTTIPAAIRKARELGDLRENAEYEAAKLKQANASKRLAQLDSLLGKIRILEDLSVDVTKANPGTAVTVRDETDESVTTLWILGEGDHHYGPEVLSYRAPMGMALLGRKVGETVNYYPPGEVVKRLTILTIEEKKPAGPPVGER